MARTLIEVYLHIVLSTKPGGFSVGDRNCPPCVVTSRHRRSTTGACPTTRSWSHYSTSMVSPTTHVIFGTEDATAPRSAPGGWRFRGSREGSLHSPARDPRLFHRPLRGRGVCRSAVAVSPAPRSRNRPLRDERNSGARNYRSHAPASSGVYSAHSSRFIKRGRGEAARGNSIWQRHCRRHTETPRNGGTRGLRINRDEL